MKKLCIKLIILFFVCCTFNLFSQDTAYNKIIQQLLRIDELDQRYRNQMGSVQSRYGGDSKEMKELYKAMKSADSLNLIKVEYILSKYGWLGVNEIGSQCNTTLFMVIQHSDQPHQEKYLPIMRLAVKNGKAQAHHLALLEDRILLQQGKKQIYGSQLSWNLKTNQYYLAPLEDPDNVDKRRKEAGLEILSDYIKNCCDLTWDVEQYKKELPSIEEDFFKNKK
ncbi:MAG: hypothetical protein K0S44_613 [Bacteroidetes bacterium]|jgi:hypothetical protein|nr:hypothetical protein [Bacteroidota bacterium]